MNYYEKIEEFIDGQLDDLTRQAFEKAMSEDSLLANKVNRYIEARKISEGLLEIDILETIDNLSLPKKNNTPDSAFILMDTKPDKDNSRKTPNIFNLKRIMIAASFIGVLVIAGWWTLGGGEKNSLYYEMYEEPIWPTTRSISSDIVSKAIAAYLGDNFDFAKKLLLDSIDNKELGKYWLAEMYLKENDIEKAIQYLPIVDSLPNERDRIIYLNLLISIGQEDLKKAKDLCRKLPKREYENVYKKLGIK